MKLIVKLKLSIILNYVLIKINILAKFINEIYLIQNRGANNVLEQQMACMYFDYDIAIMW